MIGESVYCMPQALPQPCVSNFILYKLVTSLCVVELVFKMINNIKI